MSNTLVKVFVQARMTSERYPGKVLAPFRGIPLIRHVISAVEKGLPATDIILATSTDATDDPLTHYVKKLGVHVWRGPLENVFERFRMCLSEHPCDWILRVNGDSPLLFPGLIRLVASHAEQFDGDLVTTIFPRSFPRGQNAELIKATTLQGITGEKLTKDDQEHVTGYFYRHSDRYRILNIESGARQLSNSSLVVDTLEDLKRLERLSPEDLRKLIPPNLGTNQTISTSRVTMA